MGEQTAERDDRIALDARLVNPKDEVSSISAPRTADKSRPVRRRYALAAEPAWPRQGRQVEQLHPAVAEEVVALAAQQVDAQGATRARPRQQRPGAGNRRRRPGGHDAAALQALGHSGTCHGLFMGADNLTAARNGTANGNLAHLDGDVAGRLAISLISLPYWRWRGP